MEMDEYDNLLDTLNDLKERGFDKSLKIEENQAVVIETGEIVFPKDMTIVEHHRFEGESSADDTSVIYAVEGKNAIKCTIVDSFGPHADPTVSHFIEAMEMDED